MLMHKINGYKGFFAHVTNHVSLKLLESIGGRSVLTEPIELDNNIKSRFDLVFIDFATL